MLKHKKIPEMLFNTSVKQTKSILPVSTHQLHKAQEQDHHETSLLKEPSSFRTLYCHRGGDKSLTTEIIINAIWDISTKVKFN